MNRPPGGVLSRQVKPLPNSCCDACQIAWRLHPDPTDICSALVEEQKYTARLEANIRELHFEIHKARRAGQ